jgi:hypothetical protein
MARSSPCRRRDRPGKKYRTPSLFLERFGGERLEERRVLDASAVPLWEEAPAVPTQTLNLAAGITATAAAQSGDFTYTSSGSSVTITGYTGAGGAVEIPAQIGGIPVTAIGASAFRNKTAVTGVSIPASMTAIGNEAFNGCQSLLSMADLPP